MRAEEMNVVDAAIALYGAIGAKSGVEEAANALQKATEALIFSCPQCNTDTHTCPGCGTDIGHFEFACGRCEDDSTVRLSSRVVESEGKLEHRIVNAQERLRELSVIRAARDYVHDNPPGLGELLQDKAAPLRQAVEELALWSGSDAHLLADLDQERYELSGVDQEMIDQEEALNPDQPIEPEPEWTSAEWQHVLAGDRVRLGTQEAEVTRSSVGTWHVDNSDRYRPRPWEHAEVSISLAHLDRPLVMAPGGPVEILAGRERAAVLVLQKAFPLVTA